MKTNVTLKIRNEHGLITNILLYCLHNILHIFIYDISFLLGIFISFHKILQFFFFSHFPYQEKFFYSFPFTVSYKTYKIISLPTIFLSFLFLFTLFPLTFLLNPNSVKIKQKNGDRNTYFVSFETSFNT